MATSYSQENRPVRIYTPLPDDELLLLKLEGTESLSDVYRFQLTLVGVRPDIEAADLVGKAVRVVIDLDPTGESPARTIHGIISSFSFESAQEGGFTYRAELVPWLWLLSRSSD
jgi:type VI secretion system secreted protein VgrG